MYGYDVYYDGGWLHEEIGFQSEEEALEEAKSYIKTKIDCWEADGVEWEDLFVIEIKEM